MNINKLALNIYQQNRMVGWWDDPLRCIPTCLQLVSTEIAEATEGERKNLMDDHLPHRKMGEVELADTLIRLLDLAGRFNWSYSSIVRPGEMVESASTIGGMHLGLNFDLCVLADSIIHYSTAHVVSANYSALVNGVLHVGKSQGYDVMGALDEKMVYNSNRPDHKRENRAKSDGKKF